MRIAPVVEREDGEGEGREGNTRRAAHGRAATVYIRAVLLRNANASARARHALLTKSYARADFTAKSRSSISDLTGEGEGAADFTSLIGLFK